MQAYTREAERAQAVRSLRENRRLLAAACEQDLGSFFRKSWTILEPVTPLLPNWHQDLLAEYLTACHLRQIRQIVFNLPPRYAKSNLITVAFPAWVWIRDPWERFMFWSYADELAVKHSRDRRNLIESPWYRENYGSRYRLSADENRQDRFSNDKRGHMIANSLLGGGLGEGGNFQIIDDPNDPIQANSDSQRERTNAAFDLKVRGRINEEKKGVTIIAQQRTHELDLTGHVLLTEREKWTWVKLPAEATARVYIKFPISGRKVLRERGDPLHPERNDRESLATKRKALGTYGYSGQWMQSPSPPGGTIFKRKHWKYYRALPEIHNFDRFVMYMDSSFKGEEDSCPTAIELWGQINADCYLVDCVQGVMEFPQAMSAFEMFCAQHPYCLRKLIEDTANGPAIISSLRKKIPGLIPGKLFLPWSGNERAVGKVERARAVQPLQEAGNLWLPHHTIKSWVGDFVAEAAAFPKGAFADRVDAMTGALIDFMSTESGDFTEEMGQANGRGIMTTARKGTSDGEEDIRNNLDTQPEQKGSRRPRW